MRHTELGRTRSVLLASALALAFGTLGSGCGKKEDKSPNCIGTPTGPSCVQGPVGPGNLPPGPGPGVRASATYGVYEGNCPNDPAACTRELSPTDDASLGVPGTEKTYLLRSHRDTHTVRLCVAHPAVPGRKISMQLSAVGRTAGTQGPPFDESDPAWRSPVCIAVVFDMALPSGGVTNTAQATARFNESGQDLLVPTDWRVMLGLRVVSQ